ncbi:MAG: hypothetical protein ACFE91_14370 [Promethearchaeota archaeon]
MKKLKKCILFGISTLILIFSFLIPTIKAQEWTYDGANTERIPEFSVYPSEWYIYDPEGAPPEINYLIEIVKGDISDPFMLGNGTCVWGNAWMLNTTSGEKTLDTTNAIWAYWNETNGYFSQAYPLIIPVDNGTVSESILNDVSIYLGFVFTSSGTSFEHQAVYPNIYSILFWNDTYNNAYLKLNYTYDGIITLWESYVLPMPNMALVSQPAQQAPMFNLTTESGKLTTNTPELKLIADITDADNNNDKLIDTDYLYRIYNGTGWTIWTPVTSVIDYDLGPVAYGDYNITMEVKNMYGVSSDMITIQYTGLSPGDFILSSDAGSPDEDGNFTLSWDTASGAVNYSVYEYSNYITVINGTLTSKADHITSLSLPLTGYTNGTYYFIVVAHNKYGDTLSNCIKIVVEILPEEGEGEGEGVIPSYPIAIISLIAIFIVSIIILRKRRIITL